MQYNPEELKNNYDKLPHGKARTAAIRQAIEEADRHNDVPFMLYFRDEICSETNFYGDMMYMMVVFPEMLSIIDKYPGTPVTKFDSNYDDALGHILWIYKWVIGNCGTFYQISLKDCLGFFNDFKKRYISYGYSLKPYYRALYYFYDFDMEEADKAFAKFIKAPHDSNSDCKACERITQIKHSLCHDAFDDALKLSGSIEDFSLRCINGYWDAWLRAKILFLNYYMNKTMFREAAGIANIIMNKIDDRSEFKVWDLIINCYAHTDPGKALYLYKKHQEEFDGRWCCPLAAFETYTDICCFWRTLKNGGKETVKLDGNTIYEVESLYNNYYKQAEDIAKKFDIRNHTDTYTRKLRNALAVADTV